MIDNNEMSCQDNAFIAAAREAVPALLEEVTRLRDDASVLCRKTIDSYMPYFKAVTINPNDYTVQCSRFVVDSFCDCCSKIVTNKSYRFTERKYSILMEDFNVPLCDFAKGIK
jgi:hypothetical protein